MWFGGVWLSGVEANGWALRGEGWLWSKSEQDEDPLDCCYWGPVWALGCLFLVLVYLSFVAFNIFCLYRLKSRRQEEIFRCKHLFHRSAALLCFVRALENALLVVSNYRYPHDDSFYQAVQVLAMICAIFFGLVYASVLIYWLLFVMQVRYGRYLQDKLSFLLLATQIFFGVVILLYVSFAVLCDKLFGVYYQFLSGCFLVLGIILLSEGIAFCVAGYLLYATLHRPFSVSPHPGQQERKLSSKSIQIMVLASVVTVILIIRAAFLFNEIDFARQELPQRPSSPDNPNLMYMGTAHWWFYILYYFGCDCLPLLLMMIFQSRLPRKTNDNNRNLLVNNSYDLSHNVTPSSASDISDDDFDNDEFFERMPPKMTLISASGHEYEDSR